MKKHLKPFVYLFIAMFVFSCTKDRVRPSARITTQTKLLSDYDRIEVGDAINADITFTRGTEEVVIEANANIHSYIVAKVVGRTLHLHMRDNVNIKGSTHIHVQVYTNGISSASISGASNVVMTNTWAQRDCELEVSGASYFSADVNADQLNLDVSGASTIKLTGSASYSEFNLSGASTFGSLMYECDDLVAELSGASNATLTVNRSLSLVLSGASSLIYAGNGVIDNLETSGSSTVKHLR